MSLVVQNLYKLHKQDSELNEFLFMAKDEYAKRLKSRKRQVVREKTKYYLVNRHEVMISMVPLQDGKRFKDCFDFLGDVLIRDIKNYKSMNRNLNYWSYFEEYLDDFLVEVVLHKHPETNENFIQFFCSEWAIDTLKEIMNISDEDDYSFDDRSDAGYENNYEKMEQDETFLKKMFKAGTFAENGRVIVLAD